MHLKSIAIFTLIMLHYCCFLYYTECTSDSYKNTTSNTKCLHCRLNSSSNEDRTACICNRGLYKSSDVADCKGIVQSFFSPV